MSLSTETRILKLPEDITGGMEYYTYNGFPRIVIGDYENFIQKVVANSEKELFDAIKAIKNGGIKCAGVDPVTGSDFFNTQGISGVPESDFFFVQPFSFYGNKFPHYIADTISSCACNYASKCKYHVEGSTVELPPPYNVYTSYIAFVPKKIISLL